MASRGNNTDLHWATQLKAAVEEPRPHKPVPSTGDRVPREQRLKLIMRDAPPPPAFPSKDDLTWLHRPAAPDFDLAAGHTATGRVGESGSRGGGVGAVLREEPPQQLPDLPAFRPLDAPAMELLPADASHVAAASPRGGYGQTAILVAAREKVAGLESRLRQLPGAARGADGAGEDGAGRVPLAETKNEAEPWAVQQSSALNVARIELGGAGVGGGEERSGVGSGVGGEGERGQRFLTAVNDSSIGKSDWLSGGAANSQDGFSEGAHVSRGGGVSVRRSRRG